MITTLTLTDFRSYGTARLEPGTGPVVLHGPNGAGKTNLLEALSLLTPGKGLRGATAGEMGRREPGEASGRPWAVAVELDDDTRLGTGVPGGGAALVHAGKVLAGLKGDNADQDAGIKIIRRAIQAPLRQIAENAGVDGSVVAGKVIETASPTFGFDAQSETYGDMLQAGIIDPTKVVRIALEDAASIAGLLITTEAMVAQKPERTSGTSDVDAMGGMM